MDDSELRAELAAQRAQIAALIAALQPAAPSLTVAEIYAACDTAQGARPGWKTNRYMLAPIVKLLGDRAVASLLAADWTAYRLSRKDLAPASRNLALRCLKALIRWGKREGFYRDLPQLLDARKETQKKHRETATTEADVGKLLAEADRVRDRVIVLCACDSGMRNTEIRLLQWSWVDRIAMVIHLPSAITKGHKARVVPMTARQLAAIDAVPRDIKSPYVLRSQRGGGPYCRNYMSCLWRNLATDAKLVAAEGEKRVHLHDGRAGWVTTSLERGVPIEAVSEMAGHATLEQTREYKRRRSDVGAARALFEAGIERDRSRE